MGFIDEDVAVPIAPPELPKKAGLWDRIKSDLEKRDAALVAADDPNLSYASQGIRTLTNTAGAFGDVGMDIAGAILPESIKSLAGKAGAAYLGASNKIPGVQQINRAGDRFSQAHPEAAETMKGLPELLNLAAIPPAAKIGMETLKLSRKGVGKAVEGMGTAIEKRGERQLETIIKPEKKHMREGFDIKNIEKYDIGGKTIKGTSQAIEQQMDVVGKKLDTAIKQATAEGRTGDVNDVFVKAWDELVPMSADKNKTIPILMRKYNAIAKDVPDLGTTPLSVVNRWRKEWGAGGKFSKMADTPAVRNEALVNNTLYKHARQAIDDGVPDKAELLALNKEYHDLIPIRNAIRTAIPRLNKKEAFSITDILKGSVLTGGASGLGALFGGGAEGGIVGGAGTLAAMGASKALGSAPTARLMMKTGAAMKRAPKTLSELFNPEGKLVTQISESRGPTRSILDKITKPNKDYPDVTISDYPARGFMLPDGRYLDIGGQDHRYINGMVKYNKNLEDKFNPERIENSRTKKMLQIMKDADLGRYYPESNAFQFATHPTKDQIYAIEKYIKENGKVEIEFKNGITRQYNNDNLYELEEDLIKQGAY